MNQYIKFIVRVLLTCFFIAFLGVIIPALYIVYWRLSGRF